MRRELFVCDCGDISHQLVITCFDDENDFGEVCIDIHLTNVGFWRRLKYAFFYVLGRKSKYNDGAFGEVLLNRKKASELINVLQSHLATMR
jgi:hypothetical protein